MMNSYREYSESDVIWIGKYPKDWQLWKIRHSSYVKGRVGWKGLKADEFLSDGYAYLVTGTDFENGYINWESCYFINKNRYDEDPFIQLKDNDILLTKDGTIGKVAVVKDLNSFACLNSGVFVIRPLRDLYKTEYFFYLLNSYFIWHLY